MTKVLVWNLERFGINKTDDPRLTPAPHTGGNSYAMASFYRRMIVSRTLMFSDPDIVVVIELASGDNRLSDLVTNTGGLAAAIRWLNRLRADPMWANAHWRLVPPLRIGLGRKAEGVAVFYKGQSHIPAGTVNRYFTGPNRWVGGYDGWSVPPAGPNGNTYPNLVPDLSNMLVDPGVAARVVPAAAQHNPGMPENILAARNRFRESTAAGPGAELDFQTLREPYMVTFNEVAPGGASRDLTIFGVHSPALTGDQRVFLSAMASMYDVVSPRGAAETRIVCGDFNVPLFDHAGNYTDTYQPLTNLGYSLLLQPGPPPPAPVDPFKGYFTTHLRDSKLTSGSRFLWSTGGGALSYYPGYGYMGSNMVADFESIDNVLVWPRQALHNYQTTIMNHVTGSPMNAVPAPPGAPPIGTLFMPAGIFLPGWPAAPTAGVWTVGSARQLTSWIQYGHLHATSDHFALYADVP